MYRFKVSPEVNPESADIAGPKTWLSSLESRVIMTRYTGVVSLMIREQKNGHPIPFLERFLQERPNLKMGTQRTRRRDRSDD